MSLRGFRICTVTIAVALCATALWAFLLPGYRADRLARLIRNGETDLALAMLAELPEHASDYRNVVEHVSSLSRSRHGMADLRQIEPQRPSVRQLFAFERSILVGQGWGGGNCELIVTSTSVRAGRNWFHVF